LPLSFRRSWPSTFTGSRLTAPRPPSLDEFLEEVGEREEVNIDDAGAHARAVMMVLEEAVSDKEMEDVRRHLPGEFDPLFD
jgi:uncharacterized protein (DUF2267 family)